MSNHINIDGSQGEGGGQILRTSLGLAAALGVDVTINRIRAGRPKPGLRPQHVMAARAAAEICGGELTGAEVGSRELTLRVGELRTGRFHFDIGTAGSCPLVCQTILPALMVADGESEVVIRGGTHNPMAPSFEYLRDVFGVLADATGIQAYFEMRRPGFYPAGGGEMVMRVQGIDPCDMAGLRLLSRGELRRIDGFSAVSSSLPAHIRERQARTAGEALAAAGLLDKLAVGAEKPRPYLSSPSEGEGGPKGRVRVSPLPQGEGAAQRRVRVLPGEPAPASSVPPACAIQQLSWDTASPGTVVFLRAVYSRTVAGFFELGKLGKPAETVASDAAAKLIEFAGSSPLKGEDVAQRQERVVSSSPSKGEGAAQRRVRVPSSPSKGKGGVRVDPAVDVYAADQLITIAAVCPYESILTTHRITEHLRTNAEVIRLLTGREVTIEGDLGQPGKVTVGEMPE